MVVTRSKKRLSLEQRSPSLQALTLAALALPGLLAQGAQAADEEISFQYGHYQEGDRQLYNTQSRFNPIEVESLQGTAKVKLSDRIKLAFNVIQDTWSGATPVTTAPLSFEGNREGGVIAGATPFLQNTRVFFDKHNNPLTQDPNTSKFSKDQQLVHTLSSASPETRKQGDVKLSYDWDEASINAGGGISLENDYESGFGNLGGRLDLNHKRTSVNLGLSFTASDTSARLDHDAAPYIETSTFNNRVELQTGGAKILHGARQDWASSLGLTQVINKDALLETSIGYTRSTGYLANPYKLMTVAFIDPLQTPGSSGELTGETRAFLENRPDERNQWNMNLRYVQHISAIDAALHFDYRFFSDDWGIDAHTFEADWAQPLSHGWTITPRIRYYSQDAASFYQPYLISHQAASKVSQDASGKLLVTPYNPKLLPSHYSSDHRLSGYGALSGGVTVSKEFAKGISIEAGAEYYTHAGDLKLGGGGEASYADFNYYMVNAALKVDLSALSTRGDNSHPHNHHQHSTHAPAGVMFDHMLPQAGNMMLGYRYMYGNQAGDMLRGTSAVADQILVSNACNNQSCYVTPNDMSMHMHMLDLMYAPTDWLTLMLMPQFVDMHMTMRPLSGAPSVDSLNDPATDAAVQHADHEHTTGGIGDTGLYALFKLFDNQQHHIHATLGLSAPTGDVGIKLRDSHRQELGFIHYGMQLGSGTWDFKPSMTYTGQQDSWSWGAQISGTTRLEDKNSSGFSFGDILQTTAWGSYKLLDWLSGSVRGVYTIQGQLQHEYQGAYHKIGTMDYSNSYGGHYWDVGFGIDAVLPNGSLQGNRLSFEWLQPVSDDVNGYQLEREGALSATWSYAF